MYSRHLFLHLSRNSADRLVPRTNMAADCDELCGDIRRPLDLKKCSRGWETQRENSYWIPEADIVGEVPKDLRGTLFRNGPGIREVYGTRLKHRKKNLYCLSFYLHNSIRC